MGQCGYLDVKNTYGFNIIFVIIRVFPVMKCNKYFLFVKSSQMCLGGFFRRPSEKAQRGGFY